MKILLTGGAGYIGSHMVALLVKRGYEVVVADNLRTGHWQAVKGARKMYVGDLRDGAFLHQIFTENKIDGVINFAAFSLVGESVTNPLKYYGNNVEGAVSLLSAMQAHGVDKIVFSSTAAAYGEPEKQPVTEQTPRKPATSPYGNTKQMCEDILRDSLAAYPGMKGIALRYFNPIGGHPSGLLGDDPNGIPNNLMPYIARVAAGQLDKLTIFGDDYPTPDGTCRRDYLHVVDLAKGHLKAIDYAMEHTGAEAFNLGTGHAVSVLELVNTFMEATGVNVPYVIGPRREGDLPQMWADTHKAETVLGWKAEKTVADMCRDSWRWQTRNPSGY